MNINHIHIKLISRLKLILDLKLISRLDTCHQTQVTERKSLDATCGCKSLNTTR